MNTTQLRKALDSAFLKSGERAACETLITSIEVDLQQMESCRTFADKVYLTNEINRKKQDILNSIESA